MRGLSLALVALAAASGLACRQSQPDRAVQAPAPLTRSGNIVRFDPSSRQLERVRVAQVTAATLPVDELEIPGKVEPRPTHFARLALPVSGRVRQVLVTWGDRVRAGQPLLTIETPESSTLRSAWRQAQADVTHRQAVVVKAEADASRVKDLLANRAIAQKEVLAADTALAEARAALEQAQAAQDDATRRLGLLGVDAGKGEGLVTLRSPMAGEVVEITVAAGEYRNDTASPVLAVADLGRVWVTASVPESELVHVEPGQRVAIALAAYPDQPFAGRVARVAGTLDPETRTARVITELQNPRRLLRPEMFARVRYTGPPRAVVTVPVGAIIHDEARTSVFVERGRGEFERRDVALGPRHGDAVVVTNGLTAANRVVVDGTMLLMGQ
jgi:membrane fusion protein, heavy metal efflux system